MNIENIDDKIFDMLGNEIKEGSIIAYSALTYGNSTALKFAIIEQVRKEENTNYWTKKKQYTCTFKVKPISRKLSKEQGYRREENKPQKSRVLSKTDNVVVISADTFNLLLKQIEK